MAIKLAVVKTGEQIISQVEEMLLEEKVVGYFFIKPCVVKTTEPKINKKTGGASFDINLNPWIPLGKGIRFPVPLDWIVTFIDPVDELYGMYLRDILKVSEESESQSIILNEDN
jgi:hypothetical protein